MRKILLQNLLPFALLILSTWQLSGQCSRVGWVASVTPGCGAMIIDLDNGKVYRAVYGADDLSGGQTISFSTAIAPVPPGCPITNGINVSLTCVSDTLPCEAHFGHYPDQGDDLVYNFVANIYDESTQICHWEFGDGSVATGKNVAHGFPKQGSYQVCLTVKDAFGCEASYCETIEVIAQNTNWCGYDMHVTAVGTQLLGEIFPVNQHTDDVLQSVIWYSSKSSNILAQTPEFTSPLPGFGTYLVCAQYNVSSADGSSTCASTRCQNLTVAEPSCYNPGLVEASTLCPGQSALFAPVCGCNGVQYGNECEAISAGVSNWWAGDCSNQGSSCQAQMEVKMLSGSINDGYTACFINKSSGDYSNSQLDFGDGSDIWEATHWDSIVHVYETGGIYRTNLSAWKPGACVSSAIQLLITDALNMNASSLPEGTDYVLPGDANMDGKANVYDLLNLGVGHYSTGVPRPEASTSWTPQFSPNWFSSVNNKVNYKHLDCDGNGTINEYDADVIVQHYQAIEATQQVTIPDAPVVRIEFPNDTLVVDVNNNAPIEIKGTVKVGSPIKPALGVYGLAFGLHYPEFVGHNPQADYKSDYFGSPNHMLWLAKDNHTDHQLDIGLSRKNGLSANGYGAIAEVTFKADFIIIIDVADRSENRTIPFTVPLTGVKAIGKDGNVKNISTPAELDTIWIKLVGTTNAQDLLDRKVTLSPNPANDYVNLQVNDLEIESVEVINALGQRILSQNDGFNTGQNILLDVQSLPAGVYTMRIWSTDGMIDKKLVVGK
ncbi:MAG: PKD domain-containing protein [Saprospiraceae bacterium]